MVSALYTVCLPERSNYPRILQAIHLKPFSSWSSVCEIMCIICLPFLFELWRLYWRPSLIKPSSVKAHQGEMTLPIIPAPRQTTERANIPPSLLLYNREGEISGG